MTPGRKSGKGCFNYSGRKGKDKTENKEAQELLQQFNIPLNGRYVHAVNIPHDYMNIVTGVILQNECVLGLLILTTAF